MRVSRYELIGTLGQGGMATVHLARIAGTFGFERDVALKVLHPHLRSEEALVEDFLAEARLAAKIRHPNVVSVIDVGAADDVLYLVMDYVEGETLASLLRTAVQRNTAIPLPIALKIITDALAGLHAAHELKDDSGVNLGLVHRDFSPHNILVGIDGVARLTDFGIAKARNRITSTETGAVKGKTGYISPEQILGGGVDRRSDIWAAGVVAWEAFASRRLYRSDGEDPLAAIVRSLTEEPKHLSEVRLDAPRAMGDAVARALQPERDRRYATAEDLRCALADGGVAIATAQAVGAFVAAQAPGRLDARRRLEVLPARPPPDVTAVREAAETMTSRPLPRSRRKTWVVAGTVALTLLVASGLAATNERRAPVSVATAPSVIPHTPAPAMPPGVNEKSSPPSLRVRADQRIARLQIRGRSVRIAEPANEVVLELAPEETEPFEVDVFTSDGRHARGAASGGTVIVRFSARRPASSSAPPSPRRPVTPRTTGVPFAESPYETH